MQCLLNTAGEAARDGGIMTSIVPAAAWAGVTGITIASTASPALISFIANIGGKAVGTRVLTWLAYAAGFFAVYASSGKSPPPAGKLNFAKGGIGSLTGLGRCRPGEPITFLTVSFLSITYWDVGSDMFAFSQRVQTRDVQVILRDTAK